VVEKDFIKVPGLLDRLRSLRRHQVSRNASWLVAGQSASFLLQAIFFLLLTRLLGVNEYGIFSGALALITLATPYSSLGAGMLFMRYVTTDRSQAGLYWGNALLVTTSVTLLIALIFYFVGPVITHTQSHLIFFVLAIANCLFAQVSDLGSMVFQTFEKMRYTAALSFMANLVRVLSLLVMRAALHQATAFQWSVGILVASGVAAAATLFWVRKLTGPLEFDLGLVKRRLLDGLGFSFAGTTQNAYNDIDKTMLSHYGLNRENGFYSLAYRIVDFGSTPIIAIDSAVLPRLFQRSRESLARTFRLGFRSAALTSLIGLVVAVCILLVGPWVLRLVPNSYAEAMTALRWLCWLPPLRGIHRLTGGALTASGRQSWRTASQFTVAGMNLLLNIWWIPAYGWIGAAWASVAADGSLAIFNSMLLLAVWYRLPRPETIVEMEAAKP
jgi:O-antigen/teichoic acid export membrane protein